MRGGLLMQGQLLQQQSAWGSERREALEALVDRPSVCFSCDELEAPSKVSVHQGRSKLSATVQVWVQAGGDHSPAGMGSNCGAVCRPVTPEHKAEQWLCGCARIKAGG